MARRKAKNGKLKCSVFKAKRRENIFIFSFNNLVTNSTHIQSPSLSLAWHVNLINFSSSFELFVCLCSTNGTVLPEWDGNRGDCCQKAQGSLFGKHENVFPPYTPSPVSSTPPQPSRFCWDSRRMLPFSSPFMLFIHLAMDFHRFFPRQKIYFSQEQQQPPRRREFAPEQTEVKFCQRGRREKFFSQ